MIRQFAKYYRPHLKLFVADMFCAFLVAICDLFYPVITKSMINDYIPNQNLRLLLIWGMALLAIYVLKAGLNYFIQYYGHVVGVRMQADMRRDIFRHLQNLPFSFFDEHKTGSIMSRIINDLMDITELAHHGPEDLFVSIVMLIGSFIIMCTINVPLTLIIFAFIPLLIVIALRKRVKMSEAFTQTRVEIAEVNANIENSIAGVRVSKSYTNAEHELDKFQVNNNRFQRAREYAYKTMADFHSAMNLTVDVLNLVVLVFGGLFTYYGVIDFGSFVAYLLFVNIFVNPIKRLISFVESYQNGMTGFKRFKEIMAVQPEKERDDSVSLQNVRGEIQFQDVSFTYDDDTQVLSHVDLHIPAGRTVALVGPSGGGKTTLCHLIPRFYIPTQGKILLDGIDIQDIQAQSLRKNIGLVQQDTFLFTGTILENISYGNLDASMEEIISAAKRANIHDYIMSLPEGYDTYIGERGVKLSGGQKQRLSIARVFLKNPPILILDEATSALDNTTELLIQQALEELCKGRTTLIVAHRLSTIKKANEIVVLTPQGIEERGTHEELLAQKGLYSTLYEAQFNTAHLV